MGIRQSFGMFAPAFIQNYEITQANFGFALAIQHLLFGLAQPFIGYISDKYGNHKVLIIGSLLYALGLYLITVLTNAMGLYISAGF